MVRRLEVLHQIRVDLGICLELGPRGDLVANHAVKSRLRDDLARDAHTGAEAAPILLSRHIVEPYRWRLWWRRHAARDRGQRCAQLDAPPRWRAVVADMHLQRMARLRGGETHAVIREGDR